MAVAYDTGSSGTTGAAVSSLTVAHTVAANANSALFVVAGCGENTFDSLQTFTCTYNGASMSSVTSSKVHSNASTNGWIEAFVIVLGTGDNTAHNIVLTRSAALDSPNADTMHIIGASFYNVDQATPYNGATTASGDSASPSATRASSTGNMVLFGHGAGNVFSAYGQTGIARVSGNTATACGNMSADYAAGAASVTSTATCTADWWAAFGVDIKAAAGGAADTPWMRGQAQRQSGLWVPRGRARSGRSR